MSFTVTQQLLQATTSNGLKDDRRYAKTYANDREIELNAEKLSDGDLKDIVKVAKSLDDGKTVRAAESLLAARVGDFSKPVSSLKAFMGVLTAFLKRDLIDGWLYVKERDGHLYPYLVQSIRYDNGMSYGRKGDPSVEVILVAYGINNDGSSRDNQSVDETRKVINFSAGNVANRRIVDILANKDLFKENVALRKEYDNTLDRYRKIVRDGFAKQFRFSGMTVSWVGSSNYARSTLVSRRVIHDLASEDFEAVPFHDESCLFNRSKDDTGTGAVPEHPIVLCFDLKFHEYYWVHSNDLTPHVYDKTLRNKIILPATHKDLLDILTSNLEAFTIDIVEGKAAGNVILNKGIPGVGKTLTGEVYAELKEKPLYSIHSGTLGTSASDVEENLKLAFARAKRWDCVLLLDEADVFVMQRGESIQQNAIVAVFLRTLEYFDGLLFMTTNRSEDIDEAIISRCAAIIEYLPPTPENAAAIWHVMADQNKVKLAPALVSQLVDLFPEIAPRDIKMLLRLALRMAAGEKSPLSPDLFRRCAMFRAVKIKPFGGSSPRTKRIKQPK